MKNEEIRMKNERAACRVSFVACHRYLPIAIERGTLVANG